MRSQTPEIPKHSILQSVIIYTAQLSFSFITIPTKYNQAIEAIVPSICSIGENLSSITAAAPSGSSNACGTS
jgi:hypothetical protein